MPELVTEVGSGLNGIRPNLRRIVSDPCALVVVVGHGDRLTRLRVEQLEAVLSAHGRTIIVADHGEISDVLASGMMEALSAMCVGMYSGSGAGNLVMRAAMHAEAVAGG